MTFFDNAGELSYLKLLFGFAVMLLVLSLMFCVAVAVIYTLCNGFKGFINLIKEIRYELKNPE